MNCFRITHQRNYARQIDRRHSAPGGIPQMAEISKTQTAPAAGKTVKTSSASGKARSRTAVGTLFQPPGCLALR